MVETKFTKGDWIGEENGKGFDDQKWELNNPTCDNFAWVSIGSEQGEVVAIVPMKGWNDEQLHANARLISLAPKMYKMLESLYGMSSQELVGFMENSHEIAQLLGEVKGE